MTTNRQWNGDEQTRSYLDDIGRIPLLTPQQEREHSLHIQVRDHINALRRTAIKPRDASATRTVLRRLASHQSAIAGIFRMADLPDDPNISDLVSHEGFRGLVDHAPNDATVEAVQSSSSYSQRSAVLGVIRQISLDSRCVTPPAVHIIDDCRLSELSETAAEPQIARRLSQARAHLTTHLDLLCREGDQREHELTEANLRLVVSIARDYVTHNIPLFDLIQEGNLGLIDGVQRYDHRKGFRFSTYGTWWIRQHILHCISEHTRQVRLPDYQAARIRRLREAQSALSQQHGRPPTTQELAHHLERPEHEIRHTILLAQDPMDLDAPMGDEPDLTLADFTPDTRPDVDEQVEYRTLQQNIDRALDALDPEQREVIRLRYGLNSDDQPHSLAEIARITPHTPRRAKRIEQDALERLRTQPELRQLLADYAT